MKRRTGFCVLLTVLLPALAGAADLGLNGTTLIRFETENRPGFAKQKLVPAIQFLGIDAGELADGNLSLHLYGWGRADLADKSGDNSTDGTFTYGYLRYRLPKANAEVKAGRFFQSEGGTIEQLDGVAGRGDLPFPGLSLSLFGGRPVHTDNNNTGEYLLGGRLSQRFADLLEFGASFVREAGMTKSGPASAQKDYRQIIGGDLWLRPLPQVELNGRTTYDTATSGVVEHSYSLSLKPAKAMTVAANFQRTQLRDLFSATNLRRTPFNTDANETVTSYGALFSCAIAPPIELTADYRHYSRDTRNGSYRYGGELRYTTTDRHLGAGLGFHRTDAGAVKSGAEGFAISSYNEIRGYGLYTKDRYETSIDAIAHFYQEKIYGKKSSYEVQGSAGYRLIPAMKLSGDVSYAVTPWADSDVRGLLRLTFAFDNLISKGAGK